MPETYDHTQQPVTHGRARANGIKVHYTTCGTGPPLLLLHGTPKTHYYWYKLIPLLSARFTLIAPDLRGFGATDKPAASEGYDCRTNAKDCAELMTLLGHETFHVHGEDRGAEYGYAIAALYRERVLTLSFGEMLLSGLSLEKWTSFDPATLGAQYEQRGVWQWHVPFFYVPDVPEMLIQGKEEEFWNHFMTLECCNPMAIERHAREEWVRCSKAPGGLRGILETYRAAWVNAGVNREAAREKLSCPVLAIGAPEFFGDLVGEEMRGVAEDVSYERFEECGHSLALERPERLAELLKEHVLGEKRKVQYSD